MAISYCVNCGVELAESEKKCPLCDTVVINPNVTGESTVKLPYPREQLALDVRENHWLTGVIITVLCALPALVCITCDWGISHGLSWSIYVVAAAAMVWCFVTPPIMLPRTHPLSFVVIDVVAILIFLYVICRQIRRQGIEVNWYSPLALPIVLSAGVIVGVLVSVFNSRHLKLLPKLAISLFSICALLIAVEVTTDLYIWQDKAVFLTWSIIASVPCAILALLMLLIERKRKLKESIVKRTFV